MGGAGISIIYVHYNGECHLEKVLEKSPLWIIRKNVIWLISCCGGNIMIAVVPYSSFTLETDSLHFARGLMMPGMFRTARLG